MICDLPGTGTDGFTEPSWTHRDEQRALGQDWKICLGSIDPTGMVWTMLGGDVQCRYAGQGHSRPCRHPTGGQVGEHHGTAEPIPVLCWPLKHGQHFFVVGCCRCVFTAVLKLLLTWRW